MAPLPAGGPYELTVRAGEQHVRFTDVLAGEVWLAGGQSNMQFTLKNAADAATLSNWALRTTCTARGASGQSAAYVARSRRDGVAANSRCCCVALERVGPVTGRWR